MKIPNAAADRFVAKPDPRIRAIVVYGPDEGLVAERGKKAAQSVCPDLGDAFRVVDIPGSALKDDAARLADEIAALSLMGGRRVIRVRPAGEESVEALLGLVEALHPPPAGEVAPRRWARRLAALLPFLMVPVWLGLSNLKSAGASPVAGAAAYEVDVVGEAASRSAYLSTQSEVMWRYLRRVALPYGQVFDFGLEVETEPWRPRAIVAALGLVTVIAAALAARRVAPRIALGILWFFAAIALESSIFVLDPYFEHRLYLPMFGVALAFLGQ